MIVYISIVMIMVLRIVKFATSKNSVVKSTMFPHQNIHNITWTSPDGQTQNQINHMLIDYIRYAIF
jgi:hypothetical protein